MKQISKIFYLSWLCMASIDTNYAAVDSNDIEQVETQSPLHLIILNQKLTTPEKINKMSDLLIQSPSLNINAKNSDGRTVLELATFYKADPEIIKFLISKGAQVKSEDRFNETPLHNAVRSGQIDIIKMLLAAGADKNWKNDAGLTPVDLARSPETKMALESFVTLS